MNEIDLKNIKSHFYDGYTLVNKIKPKWGKKEGQLFNMLKKHCEESEISEEDLTSTMDWYFSLDDDFEKKVKHDFGNFYQQFNKYYLDFKESLDKVIKKEAVSRMREKAYQDGKKRIEENYQPPKIMPQEDLVAKIRVRYGGDYDRFSNMIRMTYKPKYICEKYGKDGEPLHRGPDKLCNFCRESQVHKMWVKMFSAGQEVFGRESMVALYKSVTEPSVMSESKRQKRILELKNQAKELTK